MLASEATNIEWIRALGLMAAATIPAVLAGLAAYWSRSTKTTLHDHVTSEESALPLLMEIKEEIGGLKSDVSDLKRAVWGTGQKVP